MDVSSRPPRRWARVLVRVLIGWLLVWSVLVLLAWGGLPRVSWDPEAVSRWLGQRAGMPVLVQGVDAHWTRQGPVLELHGLALGEGGQVQIGTAQLRLAIYTGFLPGHSLTELHLKGLALALVRAPDGRWQVQGLIGGTDGGDPLDALSRLGEIQLSQGQLRISAPDLGIERMLPRVDLRLRVEGDRLRAGLRGWMHVDEAPVQAVVDLDRAHGHGTFWAAVEPLQLANWPSLLRVEGAQLQGGQADIQVWAEVDRWQLNRLRTQAHARDVVIQGVDGMPLVLETTELLGQWTRQPGGWSVQVPLLRIDGQTIEGVSLQWGEEKSLQAGRLALGPALQVLALGESVPPSTRQWLRAARPMVELRDVDWRSGDRQHWRGQAALTAFTFEPVGNAPGLDGVGGSLLADQDGLRLRLDADRAVVLDWPGGFGEPHHLKLQGELGAWPEHGDWRVGTSALRVVGTDYAAWIRGGLLFQQGGSRPRIDMAAALDDVPMTAAKRFWIRSKMSPGAIDWLDAALVGGHLRGGSGLVSGDLDDWPFIDNNGRFQAGGRIDEGVVHFAEGWKDLEAVDAAVNFIGSGFTLDGQGRLGGIDVGHFSAGIERFSDPLLHVTANGQADASQLLQLLRDSPLQEDNADTLAALSARGPAAVTFALEQKLAGRPYSKVNGTVSLDGATLRDRRWDLSLQQLRGSARYGNGGFEAPSLAGQMDGQPATLALRAGSGFVADAQHAFEAALESSQEVSRLLARAPEVSWLQEYLAGRSLWQIRVDVPRSGPSTGGPAAVLDLRSDLVGTAIRMPVPLSKPQGQSLATSVRVPLPFGSGPVQIGLGQRMSLLVNASHGATGLLATLGSAEPQGAVPVRGLKVNGHTPALDALSWIGLARSGAGGDDGLSLREIDLQVDALDVAGGVFDDTRLRLTPGNARIAVQMDGPSLAGQLGVPDTAGATVVGRFDRVYWRPQPAVPGSEGEIEGPGDEMNPAAIPPLALDIADLRVGELPLGKALMRSRQLTDGLQVDVLQLRRPGQAIDLQGSWRGQGEQARTAVAVQVTSEDAAGLGIMLGQGGHLQGGQVNMQVSAAWPGSPEAFRLSAVTGQLAMTARNGQLLEVEPGAGRMLGLLSLAQLPRRMMFDFRDLFAKGLAYNAINATIEIGEGRAVSRGIEIDAPAAQIVIKGETDLVGQQFDQLVEVNPRSGNLLTVVGAVAGGPVGAAVGAAANAVLAKPLGEIGAKSYKVSGPWKDPHVEVIERGTPRSSAPLLSDHPSHDPVAKATPSTGNL